MSDVVQFEKRGHTGVIGVNNPPVNALGQAVRQGLIDALGKALADAEVQSIVLIGKGRTFVAGADISEFGKPPKDPSFTDVIERYDGSPKPIVGGPPRHGPRRGPRARARLQLPGRGARGEVRSARGEARHLAGRRGNAAAPAPRRGAQGPRDDRERRPGERRRSEGPRPRRRAGRGRPARGRDRVRREGGEPAAAAARA